MSWGSPGTAGRLPATGVTDTQVLGRTGPGQDCAPGSDACASRLPCGATAISSCLVGEMVQSEGPEQTQKLPPLRMTIRLRSEHGKQVSRPGRTRRAAWAEGTAGVKGTGGQRTRAFGRPESRSPSRCRGPCWGPRRGRGHPKGNSGRPCPSPQLAPWPPPHLPPQQTVAPSPGGT